MSQLQGGVHISPLSLDKELTVQAIDILARAFQHDPLIQNLFPHETGLRSRVFFHYLLKKSDLLNEKLLGIYVEGELKGVASIEAPLTKNSFGKILSFVIESMKLAFKIPIRRFVFLNNYMKTTRFLRPKEPHHYLVFIGIDPKRQRQGLGRTFLAHIHQLVENDSNSIGIGLDTENPENVPFYEYLGYKLTGTELLDPITVFCLFKTK
jgi:GNAT superfamily N-acetyltransferase